MRLRAPKHYPLLVLFEWHTAAAVEEVARGGKREQWQDLSRKRIGSSLILFSVPKLHTLDRSTGKNEVNRET